MTLRSPEFMTQVQKFISLTARKKAHKAALDRLNKELAELDGKLSEMFIAESTTKVSTDGGTVYVKPVLMASLAQVEGLSRDDVRLMLVEKLKEMGHSKMITYNHKSMASLVKSLADEDGELPPPLCDFLKVEQGFKVVATGVKSASAVEATAGEDDEAEEEEQDNGEE